MPQWMNPQERDWGSGGQQVDANWAVPIEPLPPSMEGLLRSVSYASSGPTRILRVVHHSNFSPGLNQGSSEAGFDF